MDAAKRLTKKKDMNISWKEPDTKTHHSSLRETRYSENGLFVPSSVAIKWWHRPPKPRTTIEVLDTIAAYSQHVSPSVFGQNCVIFSSSQTFWTDWSFTFEFRWKRLQDAQNLLPMCLAAAPSFFNQIFMYMFLILYFFKVILPPLFITLRRWSVKRD